MKLNTLFVLSVLVAVSGVDAQADMVSIAIAPSTGVVTVAPRWPTAFNPTGFHYKAQDLSLGGGATQFYALKGSAIPIGGDLSAFVSYGAVSGALTSQGDVSSKLSPNSYSSLTSADPSIQTYGAANFYTIHHRSTGDYFAAIVPSAGGTSLVTDLKPMSGPGGSDTPGSAGYFSLTFASPSVTANGINQFYYLRGDSGSQASVFGVLDPALTGTATDKFSLGTGYTAIEYADPDVGYGAQRFYYLRLDPITHFSILGTFNGITGARADIANLGSVYTAFSFVPGLVFGTNNFHGTATIGADAQTISFPAISDRAIEDGSFTVSPSASSSLPLTLTIVPGSTGAAAISGPIGSAFIVRPTAPGLITLQVSQAGQTTPTPIEANMLRQSFTASGPTLLLITQQPLPKSVAPGSSVSFSVAAIGSSAIGYQWRKDGVNIPLVSNPTAQNTTLNIGNVQDPADYGVYDVVVTNASGSIVSDPAPLTTLTAPVVTSPSTASGMLGTAFAYNIVATGLVTNYGATGLPPGLVVSDSTGSITGTPTVAGVFVATVRATNITGSGLLPVTITIAAIPVAPVITSPNTATGTAGTAFTTYTIVATGSPTSYDALGLPAGLGIDSATGIISGTPTAAGTFVVTLQATNAVGTSSAPLTITIAPAPIPPVITSATAVTGVVGQLFIYSIAANPVPTAYAASGLPSGLNVNTATGTIVGIPSLPGVSTVTLSASNAIGTGTATLTITVTPAPAIPVITSATAATGTVGIPFAFNIVASGLPTSYTATNLPAGLQVNATTGAITGTPTAPGASLVALRASNDLGSATGTLTITISPATIPVTITSQPVGQTVSPGGTATFTVAAAGLPAPSLQWKFNGANIAGATGATLVVPNAQLTNAGSYTVTATNSVNSITSSTAVLTVSYSRIVNFSARAFSGVGTESLKMGFVVLGNNKTLLVRGVGPKLADPAIGGIQNPLADPLLTLTKGSVVEATNDDWEIGNNVSTITTTSTNVGAFALPAGGKDSALIAVLNEGSHVAGVGRPTGGTGVALTEIYDADSNLSARLSNVSALILVGTGENTLICGFTIDGNKPKTLLIRAVGPTLASVGVPAAGLLADPQITVRAGSVIVGTNDDWGTGPNPTQVANTMAQVGAFALPAASKDAALVLTLQPGGYNVQVTGAGNTTGVAIVEVYDVQ